MGICHSHQKPEKNLEEKSKELPAPIPTTAPIEEQPPPITDIRYLQYIREELKQAVTGGPIPTDLFSDLRDNGSGDDYEVTSIAQYPFDFKLNRTKLRLQRYLHDLLHNLHLYSDRETYIPHMVATGNNRDAFEIKEDCDLYTRDKNAFEMQCQANRERKRSGVRRILNLWNRLDHLALVYKETGNMTLTPEDEVAFKDYAISIKGESRCKTLLLSF